MQHPKTLQAFTEDQAKLAHALLATRVAYMMGRKFEEGDWADVYCMAKGIELRGWSNLDIDIMHGSLGVEQKMIHASSAGDIVDSCGTSIMHPSATRSIRVPSKDTDANEAMRDILTQYGDLIKDRTAKVKELSGSPSEPDMRIGWLLWQTTLRQFLYFEQQMLIPNPADYEAKWVTRISKGARKGSTNLWIYEKESGAKRYSVTSEAGAKIQPYFDVPPITDSNLHVFTVIGEALDTGFVRVWITESTQRELTRLVGGLGPEKLSEAILKSTEEIKAMGPIEEAKEEQASDFLVTAEAYTALHEALPGVSDEHSFQLLAQHLRKAV